MELYLRHFFNQQTQELYCECEVAGVGQGNLGGKSVFIYIFLIIHFVNT